MIMEITYGHRVVSDEDPFIAITEEAGTATVRAGRFVIDTLRYRNPDLHFNYSPGSMLVDFFPICTFPSEPPKHHCFAHKTRLTVKYYPTWLPGSSWKTNALNVRVLVQRVMDVPYNMVKNKMVCQLTSTGLSIHPTLWKFRQQEMHGPRSHPVSWKSATVMGISHPRTNATSRAPHRCCTQVGYIYYHPQRPRL